MHLVPPLPSPASALHISLRGRCWCASDRYKRSHQAARDGVINETKGIPSGRRLRTRLGIRTRLHCGDLYAYCALISHGTPSTVRIALIPSPIRLQMEAKNFVFFLFPSTKKRGKHAYNRDHPSLSRPVTFMFKILIDRRRRRSECEGVALDV